MFGLEDELYDRVETVEDMLEYLCERCENDVAGLGDGFGYAPIASAIKKWYAQRKEWKATDQRIKEYIAKDMATKKLG